MASEVRTWRRAGALLFAASMIAIVVVWFGNEEVISAWKRELDPLPFFALLVAAGTAGVPTTPFYLVAGAVFGPWTALAGSAVGVLGYQSLAYAIARGPLRQWTDRLGAVVERRTPPGWLRAPAARIALVRLLPGLPGALKNYVAAAMGAGLPLYLVVSWPLGFSGAAALVVLGDSVATGRPAEAALALLLLLPLATVALLLERARRRALRRGNVNVATAVGTPAEACHAPPIHCSIRGGRQ